MLEEDAAEWTGAASAAAGGLLPPVSLARSPTAAASLPHRGSTKSPFHATGGSVARSLPPIKRATGGVPLMPSGTGVNRYRPPIVYLNGPVVPLHDNTTLRRIKLHASKMVKQLNATMINTARAIQSWYRGERIRKRIRYLGKQQAQIARVFRGYVTRRNLRSLHAVVVPVQARVRGMLARGILRHWKRCVVLIQSQVTVFLQKQIRIRFKAAQAIQRIMRGVLARKNYGTKCVVEHGAASKITLWLQTYHRALEARRLFAWLRKMRDASRQIQRGARDWMWRRRMKASNVIQRNFRAYKVRRMVTELYIRLTEAENMRSEEERTRIADAEAMAEEDMAWFLVEDYQGRESVEKKAKELKAESAVRNKLLQNVSKVVGGLALDHPAFSQVRYLFDLYDADGSGDLDVDELRVLLKHMNVPTSKEELDRAVEWADRDGNGPGNGRLNVAEFIVLYSYLESGAFPAGHEPPADWWEGIAIAAPVPLAAALTPYTGTGAGPGGGADTVPSASAAATQKARTFADRTKRTATKLGMQGLNFVAYVVSQQSTHHFLARKVLTKQARKAAADQERIQFRWNCPPRVSCPACDQVFVFYSELEEHLGGTKRTCPVLRVRVLSQAVRYGMDANFFERRKPAPTPELVPEEYRLFAEHRVTLAREEAAPKPRRQGHTKSPDPLIPRIEFSRRQAAAAEISDDSQASDDDDGSIGETKK